ncbi:DUF72 domain-containing protein [Glycomyces sp. A-F 0318]|uniref:DUF72 domain-containing protein n=1 Tax=Glycomyces amatae TaxID=2881355 RepID=UPI001E4374BF|nr:DUF72 domain-containing protein [Glycomyces amatae]MCD0446702.1 DUF72 domain-containing protein [Glycomyces amatae]
MPVFVGTSGWQFREWRDAFYSGVPQRRWLERYAGHFATVENNSSFYGLPGRERFEAWRERLPPGFIMAVKANRELTHVARLRDPAGHVDRLVEAAAGLGDRLGPFLLQLPPWLRAAPERLAACLDRFPAGARVAVEPRHRSWWNDEVRGLLTERDAALCWADRGGRPVAPLWRTASWGYLRLHEGRARPVPSYGDAALRSWCRRVDEAWPRSADCHVYFNNDPGPAPVLNALRFAGLMRGLGREVPAAAGALPLGFGGLVARLAEPAQDAAPQGAEALTEEVDGRDGDEDERDGDREDRGEAEDHDEGLHADQGRDAHVAEDRQRLRAVGEGGDGGPDAALPLLGHRSCIPGARRSGPSQAVRRPARGGRGRQPRRSASSSRS